MFGSGRCGRKVCCWVGLFVDEGGEAVMTAVRNEPRCIIGLDAALGDLHIDSVQSNGRIFELPNWSLI